MSTRLRSIVAAVCLLGLVACGGSSDDSTDTSDPVMNPLEPDVELPDQLPTELVVTDLEDGSGAQAAVGDTLFVNYVGVLTKDGTRFDGNFGGTPFAVTLGQRSVIQGWEDGLVGMKVGGRRQLDIPADLAYGDSGAGDVIKPGDAISFVVDAVALVPATNASDKPSTTVAGRPNIAQVATEDLVQGDGAVAESGMTVAIHLVAFRADTGEELTSTWENGQVVSFPLEEGGTLPGLLSGIDGMKVGGRRQITVPFAEAWGEAGQQGIGLPATTDVVIIVDLLAAF